MFLCGIIYIIYIRSIYIYIYMDLKKQLVFLLFFLNEAIAYVLEMTKIWQNLTEIRNCVSYLAKDVAYVFTTSCVTRMVKVLHDGIEPDSYILIFLQITASKLWIFLTEAQRLLWLERRLVVQTLGMTVPPPGLEEQRQCVENEMRNEGEVQFLELWGHDELFLSPGFFLMYDMIIQRKMCIC